MYRNIDTGKTISENKAEDYINDKFDELAEDEDIFEEWLSDRYSLLQIFNLDEEDKENIKENFIDYLWMEAKDTFLEGWEEIDEEE